ncbi:hypothetical protein Btru_054675 [Bulinus truncatus]|nr:hypothetical protein Btru_054675 [Bulinus truncatus]
MRKYVQVCEMLENRIPLFDEVGLVHYYKTMDEGLMYNDDYSLRIKVIYINPMVSAEYLFQQYTMTTQWSYNKGKFH